MEGKTQTQPAQAPNYLKTLLEKAPAIRLGPHIELKLIAEEFYSRYNIRYNHRDFQRHREGIWFLMALTDKKTLTTIYIIDGLGESEEGFPFDANVGGVIASGFSTTYEMGHVTTGGWYSLLTPYITPDPADIGIFAEEDIKTLMNPPENYNGTRRLIESLDDLNEDERILLSKLIKKSLVTYLTELMKAMPVFTTRVPELDIPYAHVTPLLKTFISEKTYHLPGDAYLSYVPLSWRADFVFGGIRVYTPKARHEVYRNTHNILSFEDKAKTTIYYGEYAGRKTVYLGKKLDSSFPLLLGWEEYNDITHPRAEIDYYTLRKALFRKTAHIINILFTRRLGDVLFINPVEVTYKPEDKEKLNNLNYAPETAFEKIRVITGIIEKKEEDEKTIITIKPEEGATEIVLYHPEHGILQLPPKEFTAYEVPYIVRGHE
jgi:hypothetical protein